MPKRLLRHYKNIEEYNTVKCTLEFGAISLINSMENTKYGVDYDTITSVYKVRNTSNNLKLFNNTTLINSMISMKINGIEVEPTNEFQFDNYENTTIECEFCNLTSIPDNAFSGCSSLTLIEIPNSVTSIGNKAFYGCSSLTNITIPNSVTSIGASAFTNCYSLSEINIPDSVTSISNSTFNNCYSLTSIEIPNGVTKIGTSAFTNCYSLSEINIPDSVKSIGDQAFYYCTSLSSIEIPSSVTSIGASAFAYCESLTSITIPSDVTSISNSTFYFCFSLSNITMPNGVTTIGDQAFYGCYALSSIDIPNSVTSIGASAFSWCYSLSSIEIPNGVKSIGASAFYYCPSLTSINIPNSVTSIGASAFENCFTLSNIIIPNSVTSIGNNAFEYCHSLNEITCLAETAPTISSNIFIEICSNGVLYYPQGSDYSSWLSTSNYYLGKYGWVGVELQDSYDFKVNFITNGIRVDSPYNSLIINDIEGFKQDDNSYLFSGLQPLNSCYEFDLIADGEVIEKVDIRYKNKWITVGDNSTMLTCIYKPSSDLNIYNPYNTSYVAAYVDGKYIGQLTGSTFTYDNIGGHIEQYSGVSSIGNEAFSGCTSLSEITIPNSVKTISNSAFTHCTSLSSIEIPNSVTSIGSDVFTSCFSLSEITIPNSVTSIGSRSFEFCTSLSEITIPNSVKSIGSAEFFYCYSLNSITMPNNVTSISDYTFYCCYSLSSINIPNSVKSIGHDAFSNCHSLSSIEIPSGVTSIGSGAFERCYSLSSIDMPNGVKSIGSSAFSNCRSLTNITIPSGVTSIGASAFTSCYSLSSIDIPNGVKSIGSSAFTNCYSLSNITMPNGVTSIGASAFNGCTSLNEITIPSGVTSIGNQAFSGCTSLSEITCLAETAPTVSSNIFNNISSLGVLYYPGLNSSYDAWKQYLPNWDFISSYTPQECTNLVISAENVDCRATSTTISYTATTNGVDDNGNLLSGIEFTRTAISAPFEQNTDAENEVIRTITFEYMGMTASTTITQGVWFYQSYSIDLNDQWQLSSTISNPDSSLYDGVYESFSNKGKDSNAAICTITIEGYENFKLYVRSYAESSYDYVVVSNLDCTLSNSTTSGTNVKMTTKSKQQSGTAIGNYTLVEFSGIDGNEHTIQIMYRKDSSGASGTDQGYLLIPKNQ